MNRREFIKKTGCGLAALSPLMSLGKQDIKPPLSFDGSANYVDLPALPVRYNGFASEYLQLPDGKRLLFPEVMYSSLPLVTDNPQFVLMRSLAGHVNDLPISLIEVFTKEVIECPPEMLLFLGAKLKKTGESEWTQEFSLCHRMVVLDPQTGRYGRLLKSDAPQEYYLPYQSSDISRLWS